MAVDLNRATLEQLLRIDGLDEAKAYDLLLWRPFMSWEEVENAPTLTAEDVERLKASGAVVGPPQPSAWPTFARELTPYGRT